MRARQGAASVAWAIVAAATMSAAAQEPTGGRITLNGRPAAAERVVLQPIDLQSPAVIVTTDADGRFVAEGLRDTAYDVIIRVAGRPLPGQRMALRPGRRDADVAFTAGILAI